MDEENVTMSGKLLRIKDCDRPALLEPKLEDSEVKRVVKRLLNWYWGHDAEGSQEITDALYEFGLDVEPADIHSRKVQEHFIVMNEMKSSIRFYQEKAMKYLERIEGLEHIIYLQDPRHKVKMRDASSIASQYPYADAELRKEVERSNARESAVIDALCDAQSKYDKLLSEYWKLKLKYEPEAPTGVANVQSKV